MYILLGVSVFWSCSLTISERELEHRERVMEITFYMMRPESSGNDSDDCFRCRVQKLHVLESCGCWGPELCVCLSVGLVPVQTARMVGQT